MRRRCRKVLKSGGAVIGGVVAATLLTAFLHPARAEGFFDFLFGGVQQRPAPPPQASFYAEPPARVAPPPLGRETVRDAGGGGGRPVAFCVRLCDGEAFPMDHVVNATPVDTCRSMCPASKTKVFFGGSIDNAVARDGQRYGDTDNAFVYRKHLVPNCTCNGHDAMGLARFSVANDPTLRLGDIVVTDKGLVSYAGKRGQTATFVPVDPATVANEINSVTAPQRNAKRVAPPADGEPGVIVESQNAAPRYLSPLVDLRGQLDR